MLLYYSIAYHVIAYHIIISYHVISYHIIVYYVISRARRVQDSVRHGRRAHASIAL